MQFFRDHSFIPQQTQICGYKISVECVFFSGVGRDAGRIGIVLNFFLVKIKQEMRISCSKYFSILQAYLLNCYDGAYC